MTAKPSIWYPIAFVLSAANLVAVGMYAGDTMHAAAHGALALVFGSWALRMRSGGDKSELANRLEALEARDGIENPEEVQALRDDLQTVRRELSELNERVDFAERVLARGRGPDVAEKQAIPRP